jgi:hypothetical protein
MSELQCVARLKIHDGKLDEFKRLAAKCAELVRTKDTGTLQYEGPVESTLLRDTTPKAAPATARAGPAGSTGEQSPFSADAYLPRSASLE